MHARTVVSCACGIASLFAAAGAQADDFKDLQPALLGGTPILNVRPRYEFVTQDNNLDDASAFTLRTRLGYSTGAWNHFDVTADFENVAAPFGQPFNSGPGGNGKTGRALVADPTGTELNQFYLRYTGLPGTELKLGRQRMILDDTRFVGNVGWRQNEQTYDGYSLIGTWLPGTTVTYAYYSNVNTVLFSNIAMRSHVVNAAWTPVQALTLIGYGYLLDFKDEMPARQDTTTFGLRAKGDLPAVAHLFYTLEYAHQDGYKSAPATVQANYYLAELGAPVGPVKTKLGYEVLSSNNGLYALQTPLGTNHAFQGWADLFLTTPTNGIRDAYLDLSGKAFGTALNLVYHNFQSDHGSTHYGDETDLEAVHPFGKHLKLGATYGGYWADNFAVNTNKFWLWMEFSL